MGGGSNIDYSQRNVIDQSTQPGQGSSKAEEQIRAYFLISLVVTKSISANHLTLDPVLAIPHQAPHLNKNLKNHA